MAGLYDGFEELGFKRIDSGYLFQSYGLWPPARRCFIVTAQQKAAITAHLRQTMRQLIPYSIAVALFVLLALMGTAWWLSSVNPVLSITIAKASGQSTTITRPIEAGGTSGTIAGEGGAWIAYKLSGHVGRDAIVNFSGVDSTGKVIGPNGVVFGPSGLTANFAVQNGNSIRCVILREETGATPGTVVFFMFLTVLVTLVPSVLALNAYAKTKLEPLIAGLPQTRQRITYRDYTQIYAANISWAFLGIMATCMTTTSAINAEKVIVATWGSKTLDNLPMSLISLTLTGPVAGYYIYLMVLKARLRRNAV